MAKTKFTSDLDAAIHGAASGLYRAKVIDKKTMREYDEMCIEKPPHFDAHQIARIREKAKVSQPVFAARMNVSVSTVKQWESGEKQPSGMGAKLLQVVAKHGIEVLA